MWFWNDVLERCCMKQVAHFFYSQCLLYKLEEYDGIAHFLEILEQVHLQVWILGNVLEVGRVIGHNT